MSAFFALIDATPAAYLACLAAILVSSATHRVTGQAFGLICAPLVALAAPSHIPAVIFLCGIPIMVYGIRFDRREVRWSEVSYAFVGRTIGSVLAAHVVAAAADPRFVSICVAIAVLAGVAVSLTRLTVAITPASLLGAGFMSGAMATLTSVGAPPMGLLYQRKAFGHARATLNAFFLFGAAVSVGALLLYGLVSAADAWLALALLPAIVAGTLLGDVALGRLTITSLRPFTLSISTFAAVVLLLRTLW